MTPQLLAVNSCTHQDLVVADSLLRSRLELVNTVVRGDGHLPYYCIYVADQPTWLEGATGRIQQVDAYNFALINSEAPLRTVSTAGTRHLSIFLPQPHVQTCMPWAEGICGQRLDVDLRSRPTAFSLVATLRASLELQDFDAVGPCLVQAVLSLLTKVGDGNRAPNPNAPVVNWRKQVADCIQRHYSDPQLTVAGIAQELKVSARYLQRICEDGESPGEQLREFRLRKAAECLRSVAWEDRSITDICLACGFGSSSHFSTEFRRFYGVTPRDYRN